MSALKWGLTVFGVLLLLAGIVFALQGANILTGSALMSGNPTYIYVGVIVALFGIVLVAVGLRSGKAAASVSAQTPQ